MYQKERLDKIIEILNVYGYVTVKFINKKLNYSNATINRDLNILENRKIVIRSYGGVELVNNKSQIPLEFRYNQEKIVKRKISEKAAELICDGDIVFIDGSTTSEKMGEYLSGKTDISVVTNNLALVTHLTDCGIKAICTGGILIEPPYMLGGDDAVRTVYNYNYDKVFFSTWGSDENGIIKSAGTPLTAVVDAARHNSKEQYLLVDHSKINIESKYNSGDFNDLKGVISDFDFPEETKKKYNNTEFYKV